MARDLGTCDQKVHARHSTSEKLNLFFRLFFNKIEHHGHERERPGDDCGELLAVDSVHGEEGVESVRRDTVGQVEVLP